MDYGAANYHRGFVAGWADGKVFLPVSMVESLKVGPDNNYRLGYEAGYDKALERNTVR